MGAGVEGGGTTHLKAQTSNNPHQIINVLFPESDDIMLKTGF